MVPMRGKSAKLIGIAQYNWMKSTDSSSAYLRGALVGVIFAFSMAIRIAGGTNIERPRNIRLNAVCSTATFAHFCDFPSDSWEVLSKTSMPFLISVRRIK